MRAKDITDRRLAELSGVSLTTIRRYFGRYGGPIDIGPGAAARIAPVLDVEASDLIYGREAA